MQECEQGHLQNSSHYEKSTAGNNTVITTLRGAQHNLLSGSGTGHDVRIISQLDDSPKSTLRRELDHI